MEPSDRAAARQEFVRRVLVVLGLGGGFVGLALVVWAAADVLLVVFGGVLLAVLLRGLADLLRGALGLSPGWALAVVLLGLIALLGLGGWYLSSTVTAQFEELSASLESSWDQLRDWAGQYRLGRQLLHASPIADWVAGSGNFVGRVTGVFSTALGAAANLIVVLFVGIYLAVDPGLYRAGVLHLLPVRARDRGDAVLHTLNHTLRWWLLGRIANMTIVGVLTTLGLWALGIPLALALGVIAFVLDFVPYIGPLLSAVPACLVALSVGPHAVLYVAILYLAVQSVESYVTMPIIQQKVVEMPPALLIAFQVVLGVILGTLGIVFATPLAVVTLVLVKMLYVQTVLGDPVAVKGEPEPAGSR
jgi:predicted PurR-regulated permease PerM